MTNPPETPSVTRRSGPQFRPVAMLSLLYFAVFFFAFGMLLVIPELVAVLENVPTGPEQEIAAQEAVHAVFRPRLPIAAGLALLATIAGAWFKALPGLRT